MAKNNRLNPEMLAKEYLLDYDMEKAMERCGCKPKSFHMRKYFVAGSKQQVRFFQLVRRELQIERMRILSKIAKQELTRAALDAMEDLIAAVDNFAVVPVDNFASEEDPFVDGQLAKKE